jgi:hypothetical protein
MNINNDKTLVEVGSSTSNPRVVVRWIGKELGNFESLLGLEEEFNHHHPKYSGAKSLRSLLDLPPLYKDAILNEAILEKFLKCNCEICL